MSLPRGFLVTSVLLCLVLGPVPAHSSDGFVVSRQLSITIGHDGRTRQRVRLETRLDSLFAAHGLADPRIRFDRTTQELGILKAATILADGTVIDAPSRALNTALPDAVAQCPDFADFTEVVVSFTAVEPGVVTLLEYELVDKAPREGHFEYLLELASDLPTRQLAVTIRVPGRLHFDWLVLGDGRTVSLAEPVLERADSVYTWTGTDVPALSAFGSTPLPDDRPRLLFSTAESWDALLAPLVAALPAAPASLGQLLVATAPPEPVPAGETTRLVRTLARLGALMRVIPVPLAADRFLLPRPVGVVAASRQATPLEAGILAFHLAGCLGFEPRLVLALDGPSPEKKGVIPGPPALARIARVWVEIPASAGSVWLAADRMELWPLPLEAPSTTLVVLAPGRRARVEPAGRFSGPLAAEVVFAATVEGGPGELTVRFSIAANGATSLFFQQAVDAGTTGPADLAAGLLGTGFSVSQATVITALPGAFELSGTALVKAPLTSSLAGAPGARLLLPFLEPPRPRPLPGPVAYRQTTSFATASLVPVLPPERREEVPGWSFISLNGETGLRLEQTFQGLPVQPAAAASPAPVPDAGPAAGSSRPPMPLLRFLDAIRTPVLFR